MTCGRLAWAVLLLAPACAQTAQNALTAQEAKHRPNEVLVKFRGDKTASDAAIRSVEKSLDLAESRGVGGAGAVLLRSRSKNVDTLMQELKARSDVVYVAPNSYIEPLSVPDDPRFSEQWGLRNTGQAIQGVWGNSGADISATSAWDVSIGQRNVVVGVLDSGVVQNHPDLASNLWSAPEAFTVTIGGENISCSAGSHGFNAIDWNCNPADLFYHGTHVAGIVGAGGNDATGIAGVNWATRIMALRFMNIFGSYNVLSDAINAIEFAIQVNERFPNHPQVRVLSASWKLKVEDVPGGVPNPALVDEIDRTNSKGILFVAAAGNSNNDNDANPTYPANCDSPNIISVAATGNQDELWSYSETIGSNYGSTTVHLGAPGARILSTMPPNYYLPEGDCDPIGGYCYASGTSMAAPHVSGAAALVLSACPNLSVAELKAAILENVDYIPALSGNTITGGRLNVDQAIRSCSDQCAFSTYPSVQSFSYQGSSSGTVTVSAAAGCPWIASSDVSWITFSSGASGVGNGTIHLEVAPNPTGVERSTRLIVAGKVALVVQGPAPADLTIAASAAGSFVRGQPSAFTITVTNSGAVATSGTVTVSQTLSSGMTPAALYGNGWTCNPATLSCARSDSLAVNASYPPLTMAVNVNWNAPASVSDTVLVSGGGDVGGANNSATAAAAVGALLANLLLQNSTLSFGSYVYQASSDITAQSAFNIESGASATFASGGAIHLEPGFWAKTGSGFHAVIDPTIQ